MLNQKKIDTFDENEFDVVMIDVNDLFFFQRKTFFREIKIVFDAEFDVLKTIFANAIVSTMSTFFSIFQITFVSNLNFQFESVEIFESNNSHKKKFNSNIEKMTLPKISITRGDLMSKSFFDTSIKNKFIKILKKNLNKCENKNK